MGKQVKKGKEDDEKDGVKKEMPVIERAQFSKMIGFTRIINKIVKNTIIDKPQIQNYHRQIISKAKQSQDIYYCETCQNNITGRQNYAGHFKHHKSAELIASKTTIASEKKSEQMPKNENIFDVLDNEMFKKEERERE